MKIEYFIFVVLIFSVVGCVPNTAVNHTPSRPAGIPMNLAVFFDGTANDEGSYTNIANLHNLVTLQGRSDISTSYIKGVGTGTKVVGMAMGWGIGHDVREAYLYLAENYDHLQQKDKIYIFGFSRGAYAARILSALLYVAGIPKLDQIEKGNRYDYINEIYKAYKGKKSVIDRRKQVLSVTGSKAIKPVEVEFLGLWDTVEALGFPDYKEDIHEPNTRYADQLCNIKKAAHALSIDDDRARIFTPILLTHRHLVEECDHEINSIENKVIEVWFAGAHSDVGGGYQDTNISGISLNWMLSQLEENNINLVPQGTRVYADYSDLTHDPESGLFGLIYRKRNRNIPCYMLKNGMINGKCKRDKIVKEEGYEIDHIKPVKVHQSVIDRLCEKSPESFESKWFKDLNYLNCINCAEDGTGKINSDQCKKKIIIANDKRYQKHPPKNLCEPVVDSCKKWWETTSSEAKATLRSCNSDSLPKQRLESFLMVPGIEKQITIYADIKNDSTGIILSNKYHYTFELDYPKNVSNTEINPNDKLWQDCNQPSNPYVGRKIFKSDASLGSKFIQAIFKPFTYSPSSGYMQLLGRVSGQQFNLGEYAKSAKTFQPNETAELIVTVNEPKFSDLFYKNNFGQVKLTIKAAH